jgi:DNA-binding NarL/FixJ family response regulator
MPMTLLIVDDHEKFRDFAKSLLSRDGFDVAGEASDGEGALLAIEILHPDAVLLDVQMPGIDGIETARRIADTDHPPQVVLTSSREAADYGSRLAGVSVAGFISKQDLSGEGLAALLAS